MYNISKNIEIVKTTTGDWCAKNTMFAVEGTNSIANEVRFSEDYNKRKLRT